MASALSNRENTQLVHHCFWQAISDPPVKLSVHCIMHYAVPGTVYDSMTNKRGANPTFPRRPPSQQRHYSPEDQSGLLSFFDEESILRYAFKPGWSRRRAATCLNRRRSSLGPTSTRVHRSARVNQSNKQDCLSCR